MPPPSWTSLLPPSPTHPPRLSQSPGLSSLSHAANSHWLSVLHTVIRVSMLLSPYSPPSLSSSPLTRLVRKSVLCVCVSYECFLDQGEKVPFYSQLNFYHERMSWVLKGYEIVHVKYLINTRALSKKRLFGRLFSCAHFFYISVFFQGIFDKRVELRICKNVVLF